MKWLWTIAAGGLLAGAALIQAQVNPNPQGMQYPNQPFVPGAPGQPPLPGQPTTVPNVQGSPALNPPQSNAPSIRGVPLPGTAGTALPPGFGNVTAPVGPPISSGPSGSKVGGTAINPNPTGGSTLPPLPPGSSTQGGSAPPSR